VKDWAVNVGLAILAVFAPAGGMMATALLLVMADLITGVLAARKQKKRITSSGLQRTVVKTFVYETAIILGFLTEVYLLNHSMPISNMIAGLIGLTELKSCLENIDIIGGKGLLKQVIGKLGSKNVSD
jgi:phage-related holin